MVWMGQEYGEDLPRTIDFLPLKWEKMDKEPFKTHWKTVQRLIHARRNSAGLRSDHIEFLNDNFGETQVLRFRRWDHESGDCALAAINFSHEPRQTTLLFPWDGAWRDVVRGKPHRITNGQRTFTLAPWSGRLYLPVS